MTTQNKKRKISYITSSRSVTCDNTKNLLIKPDPILIKDLSTIEKEMYFNSFNSDMKTYIKEYIMMCTNTKEIYSFLYDLFKSFIYARDKKYEAFIGENIDKISNFEDIQHILIMLAIKDYDNNSKIYYYKSLIELTN